MILEISAYKNPTALNFPLSKRGIEGDLAQPLNLPQPLFVKEGSYMILEISAYKPPGSPFISIFFFLIFQSLIHCLF